MFTLGNVIQIGIIVFTAGSIITLVKKDLNFLKGRIEYWFGTGNIDGMGDPHDEGIGIKLAI